MPQETPFSACFTAMLSQRGATAELSRKTGVSVSNISRIASGDYLPSPAMLEQLIEPMSPADRTALVIEYLLIHRPKNAKTVRVFASGDQSQLDRLDRAIGDLDHSTRDAFATLVEAVNRAPDVGSNAIKGISSWFELQAAETSEGDLVNKPLQSAEDLENIEETPICSPISTSAESAISTGTAPAASSGQGIANIVPLPKTHWLATPEEQQKREEQAKARAAEETAPPPVPKVKEEVKYTPPARRKK